MMIDVNLYINNILVSKVVKCAVVNPTQTKLALLQMEYDNVQHFLKTGEDNGCYSAYKNDLLWRRPKNGYKNEQPLPLRHVFIKINHASEHGSWVESLIP